MTSLRLLLLPTLLLPLLLISCGGAARSTEGSGVAAGYVLIIERVLPPPGSILTIDIVDALLVDSLEMEERIVGRQVQEISSPRIPWEFVVRYDPARIDTATRRYLYQARITRSDGTLIFRNLPPYVPVTPGRPDTVEVIVHRKYDDEDR